MRFRYTPEQLEFLRAGYLQMRTPELTAAFNVEYNLNKTCTAIKAALSNNGFKCGRPPGNATGTYRIFSREQADFIKENYSQLSRNALAAALNTRFGTAFTRGQIMSFVSNHGISSGRTGRFEKGTVPPNKGVRRPGWAPGRMADTQFKKGRPAHEARNYVPIGSTRITKDGILERKVTDDPGMYPARRWTSVSRLVWEEAHGPIPPRMIVAFKPGQKTVIEEEITLDRLELISQADNMRRNTIHNYPAPIPQLVQLRGVLIRKINHTRKKHAQQN